jgi:hypothetical protein
MEGVIDLVDSLSVSLYETRILRSSCLLFKSSVSSCVLSVCAFRVGVVDRCKLLLVLGL